MRISAQPAWVLHMRPWRETSALVDLFTHEHGRVGAIARGVRGPRQQPLRAALQAFTPLRVSFHQTGELATLGAIEASGAAVGLTGDAAMAGLYLNELLLRLTARGDPCAALFVRYSAALAELAQAGGLAWTLRRFERDLLAELGYALSFTRDALGVPLDPQAGYRVDPDHGAIRVSSAREGEVSGAALLALADDQEPDAASLRALRRLLRHRLSRLLDGRPLRSWDVLGELAGHARPVR